MKNKKDIVIRDEEREVVIPAYKQKTILDHFVILMGVIFCIIFLSVSFDCMTEKTIFGSLFTNDEYRLSAELETNDYALIEVEDISGDMKTLIYPYDKSSDFELEQYLKNYVMIHLTGDENVLFDFSNKDLIKFTYTGIDGETHNGSITTGLRLFDDHLTLNGYWAPTMMFTLLLIACVMVLIFLVTHYVIDYIEVFKALIKTLKSMKDGLNDNLDIRDVFDDASVFKKRDVVVKEKNIISNKSSNVIKAKRPDVFDDYEDDYEDERPAPKKKGRPAKKKIEGETLGDLSNEEIDSLLTGTPPKTAKSLFDED